MCRPPRGHPLTKIAPYKESSRCCSHIQRRGGRPSRRKPGSKSSRWPGDRSDPYRGASNLTGRSNVRTTEAAKYVPRVKRIAGVLGVPSCSDLGEGQCRHSCSGTYLCRTPRGHRGRHARKEWWRKPGTARGSPRRSRTAKASRISRIAVKSRCACERGGWGRLSDDGAG